MQRKDDPNKDLMGDITKDFNLDEDIKHNPGFGKPLPSRLFKGDVYSNFVNTAREQGFLPPFVNLQKEIKEQLKHVLSLMENERDVQKEIEEINTKIRKYNLACPPQMQKMLIALETIKQQVKLWD